MDSPDPQFRLTATSVVAVLAVTAISLVPLLDPELFTPSGERSAWLGLLGTLLALLVPAAALALSWWLLRDVRPAGSRILLLLLLAIGAALLTEIHRTTIDNGVYLGQRISNTEWQLLVQGWVLHLEPGAIPHSYRFLPNAFTALIEFLSGSYLFARWIYRATFGLLLLVAIFRYARLYTNSGTSLIAVLLYALVYPITIRYYAGQLADPMSHLSFVIAFIALEIGSVPLLVLTIGIGALAKESVVAMLGLYALLGRRNDPAFWRNLALASLVGAAAVAIPRLVVTSASFDYGSVAGVGLGHLLNNLRDYYHWGPQVLFSVGVFVPFVVLGWRRAPLSLRRLILYLVPVLLVSSLMFSWLREARNYVPLIVPMAIITARQFEDEGRE